MYRYYLTQRPAAPGAFPVVQDNPVGEVHNYDRRTFIPEIRCQAWGYIEYRKQLELYNVAIYELIEAPAGDGLMKDRNRKKIRTGDVVKVTGALPEEDNGLFFVERSAARETILHEAGHGIQNLLLGPLMPFVVCIPSALRYWMRRCSTFRGKKIFSGVLCALVAAVGGALSR